MKCVGIFFTGICVFFMLSIAHAFNAPPNIVYPYGNPSLTPITVDLGNVLIRGDAKSGQRVATRTVGPFVANGAYNRVLDGAGFESNKARYLDDLEYGDTTVAVIANNVRLTRLYRVFNNGGAADVLGSVADVGGDLYSTAMVGVGMAVTVNNGFSDPFRFAEKASLIAFDPAGVSILFANNSSATVDLYKTGTITNPTNLGANILAGLEGRMYFETAHSIAVVRALATAREVPVCSVSGPPGNIVDFGDVFPSSFLPTTGFGPTITVPLSYTCMGSNIASVTASLVNTTASSFSANLVSLSNVNDANDNNSFGIRLIPQLSPGRVLTPDGTVKEVRNAPTNSEVNRDSVQINEYNFSLDATLVKNTGISAQPGRLTGQATIRFVVD
ncbi:fimbrial protein [Neisseriaceae bacterium TC5R-5]|nr:fimbrial protein [Neisseriaceae bacterium TC5R-5]